MKKVLIPATAIGVFASCKAVDPNRNSSFRSDLEGLQVSNESESVDPEGELIDYNPEAWSAKKAPELPVPIGHTRAGTQGLSLAAGVVTDRLNFNDVLNPGQSISSPDKRFIATFQADSNFVIYAHGRAIWASNTQGRGGSRVVFQPDGNLVMYNTQNQPLWATATWNKGAAFTRINNDGSLAVYSNANAVIWTSGTGTYPPMTPNDARPAKVGKWGPKLTWPIIPIHTVLLPDGKVFTFGTDGAGNQGAQGTYDVWTQANNSHDTRVNSFNVDIFCAAPVLIPSNGNVLIPGGDQRNPTANVGIKDTLILDSNAKALSRGPYLQYGRWYETATTLPNGEILVHGGIDGGRVAITAPEIYSPQSNSWRTLMGAANGEIISGNESQWWYPRNWVAPNGQLFGMTGQKYYSINTAGVGSAQVLGNLPQWSRSYYSGAVMYEPGKILQVGGSFGGNIGGQGSDGAINVDINGANPAITKLNPMAYERIWPSVSVLPSGEVLVTGGSQYDNQIGKVSFMAEMWNPQTKTFRPLAANATARLYHSSQLLLPDGSLLVGGGGAPGPYINKDFEIYYPPYLYNDGGSFATRPVIGRATSREDYGHTSNISFTGNTPAKVVLIKTGAVTHSFDMEQRYIPLAFTVNGKTVNAKMPANANIAPPGYYMLFILDAAGVPAVAKIVSLGVARERNALLPGDVLSAGDSLISPDNRTRLTFQADGNLVVYHQNAAIWATGTNGRGAVKATLQVDGNIVLYNNNETPIWASNTWGAQYAGGRLVMQNDANLVAYKGTQAYWASGTCCR